MLLTNYVLFQNDLNSRGLEYATEHTLALGFNAVEFLVGVPHKSTVIPDPEAAARAKEYLDAHGLAVACYSLGAKLYDPENGEEAERAFMAHAEIAAALGTKYLHHTFFGPLNRPENAPSYEEVLHNVLAPTTRIANYCATRGITCIYEPQGVYINGIAGLGGLLNEMKKRCRNVGVCGDVGNSFYVDTAPEEIFDHFAADIRHVHLKNYFYRDTADPGDRKWRRNDSGKFLCRTPLYEGDIDISHCLRRLKECGYDGAYAMEFDGNDEEMRRSITCFLAHYREVFGE